MTVNENNIINNVNETATTVTLDKTVTLAASGESLRLDVFDETGAKPASFTVTEVTNAGKVEIKNNNSTFNITNGTGSNVNYNIPDGTLYFKLYKVFTSGTTTTETLLSEQQVIKNTVAPKLAEVTGLRIDTDTANFNGTKYGESDIKTIYYCAVPSSKTMDMPYWNPNTTSFKYENSIQYSPVTKQFDVTDEESISLNIDGLDRDYGYYVYYVLENKYGSQSVYRHSNNAPRIELSKDKITTKEEAITKINLPQQINGNFTWNGDNGQYIVTLYKGESIVRESVVGRGEFSLKGNIEEGEYYIKVVKKGTPLNSTNPTLNSEAFISEKVTVKAVTPVSNIKYSVDEKTGNPKLSWTENDENCGGYQLKFYRENQDGTGVINTNTINASTTNKANKAIVFEYGKTISDSNNSGWTGNSSILRSNALYKVEIIANASTTAKEDKTDGVVFYIDSQTETYNFYSPYRSAKFVSATSSSVKIELTKQGDPYFTENYAYGKTSDDYAFSVRVYKNGTDYVGTKPVTVLHEDTDGDKKVDENDAIRFKIEGLEANTLYSFSLVTTSEGFEGWSEKITGVRTMPRIENLTRVDTITKCQEQKGTYYVHKENGSRCIMIDGKDYKLKEWLPNASEVISLYNFLNNLKTGDIVTISDENISVTLANDEESSASDVLKCDYVKDKVVTLTGNSHERKLVTSSGNEPAELHLTGTNAQFDINNVNVKEETGKIVIEDNVKVKTTNEKTLIVISNVKATMNNISMKPSVKTKVNTTGDTLTIYANGDEVNNLEFEKIANSVDADEANKSVNIKFVSENGNSITQQGSIAITGNGGTVTVTQENVTVNGGLTVNVEKGEVDVSDANIVGNKTVTLSKGATITALVAAKVPDVLVGKTLEIKNYADVKALREGMKDNVSEGYEITDEVLESVNVWLSAFEMDDKGATVKVESDGSVTIKNNGAETLSIQGLK